MGSQICQNVQPSHEEQLTQEKRFKFNIHHPPQIQKPQPILKLLFPEENAQIEKERLNSLPKQNSSDNTLTKQELNGNKHEPSDFNLANALNDQLDLQNNSRDDSNSGIQDVKHKSILKIKQWLDRILSVPRMFRKTMSLLDLKDQLKGHLRQKQKVIYSSFRKPKA